MDENAFNKTLQLINLLHTTNITYLVLIKLNIEIFVTIEQH